MNLSYQSHFVSEPQSAVIIDYILVTVRYAYPTIIKLDNGQEKAMNFVSLSKVIAYNTFHRYRTSRPTMCGVRPTKSLLFL